MQQDQGIILIMIITSFCSIVWVFYDYQFVTSMKNHLAKITEYRFKFVDKRVIKTIIILGCIALPIAYVLLLVNGILLLAFEEIDYYIMFYTYSIFYIGFVTSFVIYSLRRRRQAYAFCLKTMLFFQTKQLRFNWIVRIDFDKSKKFFYLTYLNDGVQTQRARFKNTAKLEEFIRFSLPKEKIITHRYTKA